MLAAARALVAERGADGVTMQEVAAQAAVPIGSLYQFFPDRNALLARLFSDFLGRSDEMLQDRLRRIDSVGALERVAEELVEALYESIVDDVVAFELLCAAQSNRTLRDLYVADSHQSADRLYVTARPLASEPVSDRRLRMVCFLVCDLVGSVVVRAIDGSAPGGREYAKEYARMARAFLRSILEPPEGARD